jgi:autotransporter-associated beta strand protein
MHSTHSWLRRTRGILVALAVVGLDSLRGVNAEDLSFSGTGTVRILASDWADYLGGTSTFSSANEGGRLFWRGTAGDGQYIHFNLARLQGLTMQANASVTLQNTNATWGGGVTDSFIATANGAWTAGSGAALPGATAIVDAVNPTGDYGSSPSVSWGIGTSTFQGLVDNASSFNGLAVIGGAGSQMHFNGPMNPYLSVATNATMAGVVTVAGGGAWNSGNYSFTDGVLSVNAPVADGNSGAGAVTINSLGTVFVNGNGGDNRYWAVDSTRINAGGVLLGHGHSHLHSLTLAGGELAGIRPSGQWGGWDFDDATTVTGGTISTISAQQVNLTNGTFNVDAGSTLNFTGSVRAGALTKSGAGALLLRGRLSNDGLTINGGTVTATRGTLGGGNIVVNNGGVLLANDQWVFSGPNPYNDNSGSRASLTVNAGGEFRLDPTAGFANGVVNLVLNGGSVTGGNGSDPRGALYLVNGNEQITAGGNATSTIASVLRVNGNNNPITVSGGSTLEVTAGIFDGGGGGWSQDRGGLVKSGSGVLRLSGGNGYTGQTDITAGTLVAANNTALGAGGHDGNTMSFIRDGATLALQGGVSLDEHLHVWGTGVGGLGAVRSLSGDNALTNAPSGGPGYTLRSNVAVGVDAGTLTVSGFYEDQGSWGRQARAHAGEHVYGRHHRGRGRAQCGGLCRTRSHQRGPDRERERHGGDHRRRQRPRLPESNLRGRDQRRKPHVGGHSAHLEHRRWHHHDGRHAAEQQRRQHRKRRPARVEPHVRQHARERHERRDRRPDSAPQRKRLLGPQFRRRRRSHRNRLARQRCRHRGRRWHGCHEERARNDDARRRQLLHGPDRGQRRHRHAPRRRLGDGQPLGRRRGHRCDHGRLQRHAQPACRRDPAEKWPDAQRRHAQLARSRLSNRVAERRPQLRRGSRRRGRLHDHLGDESGREPHLHRGRWQHAERNRRAGRVVFQRWWRNQGRRGHARARQSEQLRRRDRN